MRSTTGRLTSYSAALLILASGWAHAFFEVTHERMTRLAQDVLEPHQQQILEHLGFGSPDEAMFLPVSPGAAEHTRSASFLDILWLGARNEDNVSEVIDGRHVGTRRPIQHFFNPQVTCETSACNGLFGKITASPDWVFEHAAKWGHGAISSPLDNQLFSYHDARRYQACALFPARDGSCDVPGHPTVDDLARRRANAGYLFQSLGHIVHHIQDMAQPQHVRLDSHYHSGNLERGERSWLGTWQDDARATEMLINAFLLKVGALAFTWKIHEPSRFEARAADRVEAMIASGEASTWPGGVPVAARPLDFWSNAQRSGMADFASRNFPSAETQYGLVKTAAFAASDDLRDLAVTRYTGDIADFVDLPHPDGSTASVVRLPVSAANGEAGYGYYISDMVHDPGTGRSVTIDRMARLGLFTRRLGRYVELHFPVPALHAYETDESIDAQLELLVPRAIAFSKGLLQYFFRGRLELDVTWSPQEHAFLPTVTNRTPGEAFDGQLTLVRIAADGETRPLAHTTVALAPGQSLAVAPLAVEEVAPTDRIGVLFRGQLGEETHNVTTATAPVPVQEVDIVVRKDGYRHEIVNAGSTPFSGTVEIRRDGAPLLDHASGEFRFAVDLKPGERLRGLEIAVGAGAEVEVVVDGVSDGRRALVATPIQYVEGIRSCGVHFLQQGGNEGYEGAVELGEQAGNVCLIFEAYSVPDRMVVHFGNEKVFDTRTLVPGTHTAVVSFDPVRQRTTRARVEITGNGELPTVWKAFLSCPGHRGSCDPGTGPIGYRDVTVRLSTYFCEYEVTALVNGMEVWRGVVVGDSHTFGARVAAGGPSQLTVRIHRVSTSCLAPITREVFLGSQPLPLDRDGTFTVP